ncbi:MAG TPA: DUF1775 domain-containing protein [Acidimicrobiales bacterium]
MTPSPRTSRAIHRILAGVALALVTVVALAAPAAAHAEAEAAPVAAGRTAITLSFGHGCDGAPTTTFRTEIPEGATDVRPQDPPGWSSTVDPGQVRWTGGSIPEAGSFTVEMVLAQPVGSTVVMPAIQGCPDGKEEAWIQLPDNSGTEPPMPAPSFVVPANDTTPTSPSTTATTLAADSGPTTTARMSIEQTPITVEGSESNTSGLIIFVLVVGAIAIGALVLFLRYRGRGTNSRPPTP